MHIIYCIFVEDLRPSLFAARCVQTFLSRRVVFEIEPVSKIWHLRSRRTTIHRPHSPAYYRTVNSHVPPTPSPNPWAAFPLRIRKSRPGSRGRRHRLIPKELWMVLKKILHSLASTRIELCVNKTQKMFCFI
jgi:hypothetical protein